MNDTSSNLRVRNRNKEAFQLVMLLFLVFACHVSKPAMNRLPAFDKEGHRGCRGLMPENTIHDPFFNLY